MGNKRKSTYADPKATMQKNGEIVEATEDYLSGVSKGEDKYQDKLLIDLDRKKQDILELLIDRDCPKVEFLRGQLSLIEQLLAENKKFVFSGFF